LSYLEISQHCLKKIIDGIFLGSLLCVTYPSLWSHSIVKCVNSMGFALCCARSLEEALGGTNMLVVGLEMWGLIKLDVDVTWGFADCLWASVVKIEEKK
jgi:hypothetical protein